MVILGPVASHTCSGLFFYGGVLKMPIYEYECQACQNILEVVQRISEEPLTSCPDCSGNLNKLVSRSAFHLKGSGWYADGYSSDTKGAGKSSCETKAGGAAPKKEAVATCPKGKDAQPCSGCTSSS